jgi:hypothetical protein
MADEVEAGKGQVHVYPIPVSSADTVPLQPNQHYLGIDAVSWFFNKKGNWFVERTASGTLHVALVDGQESYQTALGTFELRDGLKIAPAFDKPVLRERNYRGSSIHVGVSLTSFKKDTALSTLLKSAASASLDITAGMVQTASLAGPQAVLADAGRSLIEGVSRILKDEADGREVIFPGNGIEMWIRPETVIGPESYYLFHRGSELNAADLSIGREGVLDGPHYKGRLLQDGAWLLLRLRRSVKYLGERSWFGIERDLRLGVENVVSDVSGGTMSRDEGLRRLMPSSVGNTTLFDKFIALREFIQSDGVITETDARLRVEGMAARFAQARRAISTGDFSAADHRGLRAAVPVDSSDPLVASTLEEFERVRSEARIAPDPNEPSAFGFRIRQ